ncbi:MAG: trypsin-like peptidase domain-containing protein [Opitutales bacterium]|nr:trypsin-like peptidase domain-containing protein [Opitutales bacterium]
MRCKFWLTNRIFLLPFLCLALQAKPTVDLYTNISPGCVEILVGGRLDGSGVIVDTKGLVMTAFHVVRKKGKKMEALSHSLGRLPLRLIATNRGSDLALLALPEKKGGYSFLPFAKQIPTEGTTVFLMGSPIFRHNLLLRGAIARRSESYSWYDGSFTNTFPITGIAAPGTSGGPWVNQKGEVFAIQVAGVTTERGHQGVSSAVGLHSIKLLLEKKATISVPTIQAAVEELWGQSPFLLKTMPDALKGLLFRQVSPKGVCGKAGIKDEDIMREVNGITFQRIEPFISYIRSLQIGEEVEFLICDAKGENKKKISILLAELR